MPLDLVTDHFPCRFEHSSGKGHLGYSIQVKALRLRLNYAFVVDLLNFLGIAFAVVGIRAAFLLFTASTYSGLVGAQQSRSTSNRVSLPAQSSCSWGHRLVSTFSKRQHFLVF